MSVSVEITSEIEAALRAEAVERGLSEAELLRVLLEERYSSDILPSRFATAGSKGQGKMSWDDFAAAMAAGVTAPLSDYAMSREGIYEDHP
jgi:hypothetical protein